MSQIGNSVGLTVGAVIAASVTASQTINETSALRNDVALEKGFQAAFWACAASIAVVVLVSSIGLKKAGNVGLKSD